MSKKKNSGGSRGSKKGLKQAQRKKQVLGKTIFKQNMKKHIQKDKEAEANLVESARKKLAAQNVGIVNPKKLALNSYNLLEKEDE